MIKAVTIDLWGTVIVDSPSTDERYRRERLAGLESTLLRFGFRVPAAELARAYGESGRHLARIWRRWRDVPVERHVTLLLQAVDPALPGRVGAEALIALTTAYSSPTLLAPPTLDEGIGNELVADYSEKRRITSRRADIHRRSPVPLRAIYVLSPPRRRRGISIARIEPREAVGRLLAHTHRLDLTDRNRLVAELDALSRLAARVPVFELAFPRDLTRLAALRTAVLRHAGAEL